ncbi:MAG: AAA family ATPase [Sulfurifustaceae bacterium]
MYTRYFGLHENPFALPPDPRYLYLSPRHQEALAHLMYGITQGGGFVQLTGEVGTGKTMMIRALLDRLPPEVHVALVLYPLLSVEEFVLAICDDLRIPRPENASSLKNAIDALNRFLLESHARGQRTVLIIDEAHKLSHDVLEQVRLLTNLETTKEKLLQILLVGQPELSALLAQPSLRQLAQRITARYNLTPLSSKETAEYVVRRLRVAGAQHSIFTRGALSAVHRVGHGTPRLVNTICDRALLGAYAHGKNRVTAAMVRRAAEEVGHERRRFSYVQRTAFAASVAALAAAGVWQLSAYRPVPAPTPVDLAVAAPATPTRIVSAGERAGMPSDQGDRGIDVLLSDPKAPLDMDSAMAALFAHWGNNYRALQGNTGCERALKAGLHCFYATGTWNNLRELNRPAIIELIAPDGQRRQALVKAVTAERVALEVGGQTREFPLATVDRRWYGKFLTLWRAPPSGETPLRVGVQGPAIVWLRGALAKASGTPVLDAENVSFDTKLEKQVKAFQRRHHLDADGVVGRNTLILLDRFDADSPPTAEITSQTKVR